MSGLVVAVRNRPGTPGRGLVTGEALLDRDLSGLELAVLSACETGLGDVAGGEGVFGLQRALHLAGCRDVVASLWKVPDAATAALMGEFYRALWDEYLPPVLALQKAQAGGLPGQPEAVPGDGLARRGPGRQELRPCQGAQGGAGAGRRQEPACPVGRLHPLRTRTAFRADGTDARQEISEVDERCWAQSRMGGRPALRERSVSVGWRVGRRGSDAHPRSGAGGMVGGCDLPGGRAAGEAHSPATQRTGGPLAGSDSCGEQELPRGQFTQAVRSFKEALRVAQRLYPSDELPHGHANLATSLNNLAVLLQAAGKNAEAEPLLRLPSR